MPRKVALLLAVVAIVWGAGAAFLPSRVEDVGEFIFEYDSPNSHIVRKEWTVLKKHEIDIDGKGQMCSPCRSQKHVSCIGWIKLGARPQAADSELVVIQCLCPEPAHKE